MPSLQKVPELLQEWIDLQTQLRSNLPDSQPSWWFKLLNREHPHPWHFADLVSCQQKTWERIKSCTPRKF